MSLLRSIFGGKKEEKKKGSGKAKSSADLVVKEIVRLTDDSVKVVFEVPAELKENFSFIPGQYLNLTIPFDGKNEVRSYSICSGINESLAIGVKKVEKGLVSSYLNDDLKVGDELNVAFPMGNFNLKEEEGNYVGIAAGSGVTPVLSIAKSIQESGNQTMDLIYANRTEESIMFKEDIEAFSEEKVKLTHVLSDEEKEGVLHGMMTEEMITSILKNNLSLLRAKGFYICGPEPVIINAQKALKTFGVPDDKIYFELFTTPVEMEVEKKEVAEAFVGVSKVTVILDGEEEQFELATDGDTILEEVESYGVDAPYSCRGGVCTTCRAKVIKGTTIMDKNFALTDQEVEQGYTLTCQAHPSSEEVIVSYDE